MGIINYLANLIPTMFHKFRQFGIGWAKIPRLIYKIMSIITGFFYKTNQLFPNIQKENGAPPCYKTKPSQFGEYKKRINGWNYSSFLDSSDCNGYVLNLLQIYKCQGKAVRN